MYMLLKIKRLRLSLCVATLLFTGIASAQEPATFYEPEALYERAMELYDKEKYAAAQQDFDRVHEIIDDEYREVAVNSEWFAAMCAMNLFHKDTEHRLANFVKDHPESAWVKVAFFELGNYYYRRRKYKSAVKYYDRVRLRDLTPEQTNDLYFKQGYCQFKSGNMEDAKHSFSHLVETDNKYYAPANYYHAHMSYEEGNYETALKGFQRLEGDENFAAVTPYYVSQILFLQKKYDEVIAYAPDIIKEQEVKKENEIARIIGESYYNIGEFGNSIPYLEAFHNSGAQKTRQDHYQLGFAYYKAGEFESSIESFNLVTNQDDELTQIATYHMGDCYLKTEKKTYARNAFKKASEFDFDRELKEDALFNYAKLAYELSVNPFHEAIRAFEKYLEDYPGSERRDQAYEFLLDVYLTTKNYQRALDALAKIKNKSPKIKSAYQLSAYNRGSELFLNNDLSAADAMFDKVSTYPMDPKLTASAAFWKAEILYKNKEYDKAILAYKDFQSTNGSSSTPLFKEAHYSTAYSYFRQKEYSNAETGFNLFLSSNGAATKTKKNDAYLRLGDCAFVAKQYDKSVKWYDKAIELNVIDGHYALFQKARCQGYQENDAGKIATLQKLVQEHEGSSMYVPGKYQLGQTYFKTNKIDDALIILDGLIADHPNSPYVKKSLLTKGLIHYRKSQYEEALAAFKTVVEKYKADKDSETALLRLQDVYVELGRMDDFNAWYEQNVPTGSVAMQDSVNYRAAENKYTAGDCETASAAFTEYIKKFQPGIFGINASFYLAECQMKEEEFEMALNNYLYVIGEPTNPFSEPALYAAATITYGDGKLDEALQHYIHLEQVADFDNNRLEARIGQMRIYFKKGEYDQAMTFAEAVLADEKTPEHIQQEAHMVKAKVLLSNGDVDNAREEFWLITQLSSGKMGAEAKFNIARIYYDQEKYDLAETEIFDLIKEYPSQEYWKIEAFMMLADVYVGKDDFFQAKATLQTIIDNVTDEDVMNRAISKYQEIVDLEEAKSAGTDTEMEIEMGEEDYDELFDEEE